MLPRRNILIFHQAALGDFIVTWPLAMALGRVFAQSRVMYVTGADKGRLAEETIGAEWVGVDTGWHALHAADAAPDDRVVRLLKATQCVVLFAENDEPTFVGNVAKYAGDVPLIHVRPLPPPGVHVLTHQLAQLDGTLRGYVEQMQNLMRTHGVGGQPPGRTGIVLHPGSGSPDKNWPAEHFIALAAALRANGEDVTIVLGEVERDRFPAATLKALRTVARTAEPPDLPALRATLTRAHTYVGNDSGPTHLAAALGLRTFALFGDHSSVDQWRPTGPAVDVLPLSTTIDDLLVRLSAAIT